MHPNNMMSTNPKNEQASIAARLDKACRNASNFSHWIAQYAVSDLRWLLGALDGANAQIEALQSELEQQQAAAKQSESRRQREKTPDPVH